MEKEMFEEFKNKLIEIVYDGKYEQPTSIHAILVSFNDQWCLIETKKFRYLIPIKNIKSIRYVIE